MAQYRYNQGFVQRSKGGSAVAKAAYNSREVLKDERLDKIFNYKTTSEDFVHAQVYAPHRVGEWARDRQTLMNRIEASEKRKDAVTAMTTTLSLPRELTDQQNIELVKDFVQKAYVSKGMIVDTSIHKSKASDGEYNPHAHLIMTTRKIEGDGFYKKKEEQWRSKPQLNRWREQWAEVQNTHLREAGHNVTVDHRTLSDQNIDRVPTKHEGKILTAKRRKGMEQNKGVEEYDRLDENYRINHKNKVRAALKLYEPETVQKELVLSEERMKDYSPEMKAHMEKVKKSVENTEFLTEAQEDMQKSNFSIFMQKTAHYARYISDAIKERFTQERDKDIEYTR